MAISLCNILKKVLENHHAATAFKLLRDEEYNIFEQLSFANYKILRKRTISNILATDMTFHLDELEEMKKLHESDVDVKEVD